MQYVYILRSQLDADHFYVGTTTDQRARLTKHYAGKVTHTAKFWPWLVKTYLAFNEPAQAFAFESYLKSASGRAFAKKAALTIPAISVVSAKTPIEHSRCPAIHAL